MQHILETLKKGSRNTYYKIKCLDCPKLIEIVKHRYRPKTHRCKKCNAKWLAKNRKRQYPLNENFFKGEALEVFYWAGFIAADGNIYTNRLQIAISKKDESLLERFQIDLDSFQPIREILSKNQVLFSVRSDTIKFSLEERFNIVPNKSLVLEPPDCTSWTEFQILSFIVGYIDGDGCISFNKGVSLRLVGTHNFLFWVKENLEKYCQVVASPKSLGKVTQNGTYELRFYSSNALKIIQKLKKLPIKKLKRKWSKAD